MSPVRVCILLPSLAGGGVERVALTIAENLAERGCIVDIVLAARKGEFAEHVNPSLNVVELMPSSRIHAFLVMFRYLGGSTVERYKAARYSASRKKGRVAKDFAKYLKEKNPAVVLARMTEMILVAVAAKKMSRCRARLVASEHNQPDTRKAKFIPYMKNIYRSADAITAVSHDLADELVRILNMPRERINVIYNPATTENIPAEASMPSPHPWLDDDIPVILGAGRLHPQKDFPTLIRAFAEIRSRRPCRLMILGEGLQRTKLERLAEDLGVEKDVRLTGFDANPFAWMSRADVFALSSKREGFGNVLVEALACGCPAVSADCPSGPKEILADGQFGELVPVRDPHALARAIEKTIDNPPDKDALIQRADEFSPENIMPRYMKILFPRPDAIP